MNLKTDAMLLIYGTDIEVNNTRQLFSLLSNRSSDCKLGKGMCFCVFFTLQLHVYSKISVTMADPNSCLSP